MTLITSFDRPARYASQLRAIPLVGRASLVLALALGACVPAVPVAPTARPSPQGTSQWQVEPGDVIRLKTWGVGDQSGELVVNERGQVVVPNVGRLTVAGLTPAAVEALIVRSYTGRFDSSRVEVTFLRPVSVVGGVKLPGVTLADPSASVLSLVSKAGGPVRLGGDLKVYLLRVGEAAHEVSVGDRVSDLGIRSTDQLYVQDPPFAIRNEAAIRSVFELLQFVGTTVTLFLLIKKQ